MVQAQDIARLIGGHFSGPAGDVCAIHHHAASCQPKSLFVAIQGARSDGHQFIPQALSQGALGVISERPCPADFNHIWIQVPDARLAIAQAAAAIHGYPSHSLNLVGITGTNGKTTTAYLLNAIFQSAFGLSAMMGTVEYRIGNHTETAHHTTPEASEIQYFLRRAVDAGCKYAVMEVSSHAIDLHRAAALNFAVAVFSNLTQDHLDYHKTMEAYFDVKRRLFDGRLCPIPPVVVLNRDDPYGERLYQELPNQTRKVSYGIRSGDQDNRQMDIWIDRVQTNLSGLSLTVHWPHKILEIKSPMVGKPHAYNILASVATATACSIPAEHIVTGISQTQVPGRFERVDGGSQGFAVVVDYAHTPDAVQNALGAARELVAQTGGRVITLFGCGGDRDRTKRPLMAEAAAQYSDIIVATSDNPRSESPEQILDDAEIGLLKVGKPYHRITDRRQAITFAIQQAQPGDIVVLAGKGHEPYQILADRTIHFDDREEARQVLRNLLDPPHQEAACVHS
ncbi:MAG: UDP-N-acetylmuramoyl-L-alanyl-D-glutamate--2,6-diaminopimelate ligase [Acidobacteria bacterium]|nr:UDP-N-acetylmuramoyl-L-alanyl-D-glutamate--2,6-diaminopimelate ligase [Acidobacteriota bacterium]